MKNLFKSILIAIAFIFNASTQAQTESLKLENSLLWKVSGKGLEKPSYLYGTIHMICGGDYFLSEKTKKAFEASDKLMLEINFADPKEIADMQKLAMSEEPLSKKLNPEQLAKLDAILKKTTGMTAQQVDNFSLMTVMSLISIKNFGCEDIKLYEMEFVGMAKKRNIEVGGLETSLSQFAILEKAYSDNEIIAMLEESTQEEMSKLVEAYKAENIEVQYALATDKKVTSLKTKKTILDDRNKGWMKNMPVLMQKEGVFFAVGAAHLVGEFGLINLLRKAGYTVKPVMN